jgi:hypothetical protein
MSMSCQMSRRPMEAYVSYAGPQWVLGLAKAQVAEFCLARGNIASPRVGTA